MSTHDVVEGDSLLDAQRRAAEAAIDEWTRTRAAGPAHAAAIRAWATPTRPPQPAPTPTRDGRSAQETAWEWQRLVTEAMGRVKERRGVSLYAKLPDPRRARPCSREGCTCTHGEYRDRDPSDRCNRGFVPTPDDPDGIRETARCPSCRRYAETTKTSR